MKRNIRRAASKARARLGVTPAILATCGWALGASRPALAAQACETDPPQGQQQSEAAPRPRLNPTGRSITLQAPLRDGQFILGEVDFVLGADDSLTVNAPRLLETLRPILDPAKAEELASLLAGKGTIGAAELTRLGYVLRYVPETVSLAIEIPPEARTTRQLTLRRFDDARVGAFDAPARLSGYVNFRTFTDFVWQGPDSGLRAPTALIDSAVRYRGFVLENEATLRPESAGRAFVREGSRIVYDDRAWLTRWTAGDLRPLSRGFATATQLAGLSVVRLYSILDPQRNIQPRGDRTFVLTRASTVEAFINDQPIRRIRLEPGTYNLRDLPFVQGGNDVRLVVEDEAGGREEIQFSLFFDRTLLARGLTEFGAFAGFRSRFSNGSLHYDTGQPAASGFVRRGFSDSLTAGMNFSASHRGALIGGEVVAATPFGTLGADLAGSRVDRIGTGYAFNLSLLTTLGSAGTGNRTISAVVEHRSANFASPNDEFPDSRFSWEFSGTYAQPIGRYQYVSVSGQYSIARNNFPNEISVRALFGAQLTGRVSLTVEGLYEDNRSFNDNFGVRARLIIRLGRRSSASAEYDSRFERGRIGYQTYRGDGVGSWSVAADADVGKDDVGFNGNVSYLANRAELGLNHSSTFDISGQSIDTQRSSLRVGTSLVFADGHLALSRPIYDSFVMVRPHRSLDGASVYLEPREGHYTARSDFLGPAVDANLPSYIERVVTFDVPTAPSGYDLGRGNVRVFPPYRAGYLITAGSDYSVTAIGTLTGPDGRPVSLLAGRAIELDAPGRPPVIVFTNRGGRFGVTGLRPGRWRIEMPTEPPTSVLIEVPPGERGVVRLGDVRLGEAQ